MKIYTKQGDKGTTAVYTKEVIRVSKDDILVETYGTLDELNSQIGLLVSCINTMSPFNDSTNNMTEVTEISKWVTNLQTCQHDLFTIGFALSDTDKLTNESVGKLETWIDTIQSTLPPQTHFILPGGSFISSQTHVVRTIARRAERTLVSLSKIHDVNATSIAYLNRLSDFMFVFARLMNKVNSIEDIKVI